MTDKKRALGRGFDALVDPSRARPAVEARAGGNVLLVAVERIKPNRYQPRQQFDDVALQALAASVKRDGVLQPLAVRRHHAEDADYELIAGERRLRAAKLAGLREVPCHVIDAGEEGLGILSLVELGCSSCWQHQSGNRCSIGYFCPGKGATPNNRR